MSIDLWLILLICLLAGIYASVGHGGASGYLAVLVLAGFARPDITPVVLAMNIFVATTSFLNYRQAGHFSPRLLIPFVVVSIPASFVGGMITVNDTIYSGVLGGALFVAAFRFFFLPGIVRRKEKTNNPLSWSVSLPVGGLLGFLSGVVGVGGGIFLSPLMLLMGWADARKTGATSAAFIVLNSTSGLSAHLLKGTPFDWSLFIPLVGSAFIGGFIGSFIGARHLSLIRLQQLLGGVLAVAGFKLLLRLV